MKDEVDALLETAGRRGFAIHELRNDDHGLEALAAVLEFGTCADVVILIDEGHACAYRTPTAAGIDPLSPTKVLWSYTACPVWTLRALLTLPPPGHPDAPAELVDMPGDATYSVSSWWSAQT